ncbi:hypothetical protein [Gehongia tenuis]|uniref:Uncharacterized protein n=1 Tax=Gehongia tenuis TaxID=2763655 RepID=A0A926HQ46_9FIRM|nr:hypothetical protein [Gehongia tenuis]MBC8532339.1 hypothetical protein [Gehongia tenuis]
MKYVSRVLWFVVKNLFIIGLVIAVIVMAFSVAMDITNSYVLTTDGMKKRAEVVLQQEDSTELPKFFTTEFIEQDSLLNSGLYKNFKISDFDYEVNVEHLWAWPWSDSAEATISERATVRGEMNKDAMTQEQIDAGEKISPPTWEGGRYKVTLLRVDGKWKLDKLELIELLPEDESGSYIPQKP